MKKEINKIRTANGVTLGERILRNGETYMKTKSGNKYDVVSPKQVVELITGCKVERIIYKD